MGTHPRASEQVEPRGCPENRYRRERRDPLLTRSLDFLTPYLYNPRTSTWVHVLQLRWTRTRTGTHVMDRQEHSRHTYGKWYTRTVE